MAPFRPTNINKRAYPKNGNVIGPLTQPTAGIVTANSSRSISSIAACACYPLCLGCRCSFCACACCNICCCCSNTTYTPSIPSGRWSLSQQVDAIKARSWGGITSTCAAETLLCCTGIGYTAIGNVVDCKGFFIQCGPSTNKWFMVPRIAEISRLNASKGDGVTVANSCLGACGWFVPSDTQWSCGGFSYGYWDFPPADPADFWGGANTNWWTNCGNLATVKQGCITGANSYSNLVRTMRCTAT